MAQIGRFVQQTLENDLEGDHIAISLFDARNTDVFPRLLLLAVESSSQMA
jgi:hypothetical protein